MTLNNGKKIKVLVVDDSMLAREIISKIISSDEQLEVVATAVDPFDARDKLLRFKPDVMICDVEMPKMNGVEFIRRLMPQYPLPVIVVSSVSEAVFDAMSVGAVDFITKPDIQSVADMEAFVRELNGKIHTAAKANIEKYNIFEKPEMIPNRQYDTKKIIAIGASTGGTEALYNVLKDLPPNMPGIVVVQHIPARFSKMFADRLNIQTKLHVKEAEDGDILSSGMVVIAPGDRHIRIKKNYDKYRIECIQGEKVNGHCPSVDVLFESVAREAGKNAIGVILTGMGSDGARGLWQIRKEGARTIGQDERTCVVYGMPKIAYEIGAVEMQLPLNKISYQLHMLLQSELSERE